MSRLRILIGCCLAAAVGLFAAEVVAQQPPAVERIAAGVTAAGQDVSGLTVAEAAVRLQGVYGERLERGSVSVRAADLTWRLTPAKARVRFDALASAQRALEAGRSAFGSPVDVPLAVGYSKARVERFAGRIDRRLRRKPRDAQLRISVTRVGVTRSRRGRDIDGRQLARGIGRALRDPRIGRVFKPTLLRPKPKLTADKLRRRATTVITIHQATFTLRLFKNFAVVRSYRVAVGQSGYPTPRGRFAIQSKQVNPVWSVPNAPWAGELAGTTVSGGSASNPLKARWMGIVGGVGIHGTGQAASIGTRASHGCIRMHVPDVIELFGRVPIGTPVLIA
ncbi:MAG: L,D-transpeptidase/peptidoglycan binding protein [Actinobacteria bacterium]|nr:L,D-transpeptidase/peptidoglycan binding protein [Actinomycetota bacterium]